MRIMVGLFSAVLVLFGAGPTATAADLVDLTPGVMLTIQRSARFCTAGFAARTERGSPVVFTAGHCGAEDTVVYTPTGSGDVPVGQLVVSQLDGFNGEDTDIALIQPALEIEPRGAIVGTIPVAGYRRADAVAEGDYLCKVGVTTGHTCGVVLNVSDSKVEFAALTDEGDSGAPVYMMNTDGSAIAVGIEIRRSAAGNSVAELIGPWLEYWQLHLI